MTADEKDRLISALETWVPKGNTFLIAIVPTGPNHEAAQTDVITNAAATEKKRALPEWLRTIARAYEQGRLK